MAGMGTAMAATGARLARTVLFLLLALPAGEAAAQKPEERFTPLPAPTVALPRLTPSNGARAEGLTPGAAWHPPPVVAPLLSPIRVPGAPPAPPRSASASASAPAGAARPAVAKPPAIPAPEPSPAIAAEPPPAPRRAEVTTADHHPKPGRYAKASRADNGCALPDDMPSAKRRAPLPDGTVARVLADANLRVAPACDAKVADVLENGDRVTVLDATGSWYRVGRKGRTLGYVGAALLGPAKGR